MKINVIYEDADILAVNKPSGLKVHHDGSVGEIALTDWILEKYPDLEDVGEPIKTRDGGEILRPGIVHRIDKETSGVLLIAKTESALNYLKNEFKERRIQKIYNCFVYGKPKISKGEINEPIGRSHKDFRKKSTLSQARGEMREALTGYKVLKTNKEFSFLEVCPKTGRTHQIRVHLKSIGHPIICDPLYFQKSEKKNLKKGGVCPLGFSRLALHAKSISFLSCNGEKLMIDSGTPQDFENALKNI